MQQASDVMTTGVITLSVEDTVHHAICTLLEYGISGAPVVDLEGRLVGVVSEYQLLEALYSPEVKHDLLRDVMTRDPLTIAEDAPISEAANLLIVHRIRRIPVVREARVVGIIARRDLLRHVVERDAAAAAG